MKPIDIDGYKYTVREIAEAVGGLVSVIAMAAIIYAMAYVFLAVSPGHG